MMSGDGSHGAGAAPRAQSAPEPARGVVPRFGPAAIAPLAAAMVAVLAIVGAYLTSHAGTHRSGRAPASTSAVAPSYPAPAITGASASVVGPDGTNWRVIGKGAAFELTSLSQNWVAFKAASRVPQRLEFVGAAGEHATATLEPAPQVYLAGPLSAGRVKLTTLPAPGASKRLAPSDVPVISSLRATVNPVAAVPGTGFWTAESAGGVVFNWMRGTGVIDVYAPRATTGHAWLIFDARSLGGDRTLTVRSGAFVERVRVSTLAETVTLGPFALSGKRARVTLIASPGPARYAPDPRTISVQIASLGAFTAPGEA
jgi:hypothetical protein